MKAERRVGTSSGSLSRLPDFDIFETAGELIRLAKTIWIGKNARKVSSRGDYGLTA